MKDYKYLLYIDILGFSDLAKSDYSKVKELFSTINELNVHKHYAFQTIVFSDTILIFNKIAPTSTHDHEYLVMYACEFVQDLIFRCRDLKIQFRAILTYDEFYYEKLENIEAYHGKALINAYNKEKEIMGLWLFMDKRILHYNKIFPSVEFDKDLDFVFLLQGIERLNRYDIKQFPIKPDLIEETFELYDFKEEVQILKTIKDNVDTQQDSRIRAKYLQTYYLFKTRYKIIIETLEKSNFDYHKISPEANWDHL